jgi:hypothetical protein
MRSLAASFTAGYISGIFEELISLLQTNKFSYESLTAPQFRDLCFVSGWQQVSKDLAKSTLKTFPFFEKLSFSNPFLFGAATGLPMWFLTKLFATPLQNSRNKVSQAYTGFVSSVINDFAYHSVKNGLDEYSSTKIDSFLFPKVEGHVTKSLIK